MADKKNEIEEVIPIEDRNFTSKGLWREGMHDVLEVERIIERYGLIQTDSNINEISEISHNDLTEIGVYTHEEIDEYIIAPNTALDWTKDQRSKNIHYNNITEVSITQHEAAIDHDALTNFVSAEHIDWTDATDNFKTTGTVQVWDAASSYLELNMTSSNAYIKQDGAVKQGLHFQQGLANPGAVSFFDNISAGNPAVYVYGFQTGVGKKWGWLQVDINGVFVLNSQVSGHLYCGVPCLKWDYVGNIGRFGTTDTSLLSFGADNDYAFCYYTTNDELQLVDGALLNTNVRMTLDSTGNFDFKAGDIGTTGSISGVNVTSGADPGHTHTGSSISHLGLESLSDPDADRIVFWDDSEGALKWLACGNSIAITTVTLDTIQDIRTTASPTFAGLTVTGTTSPTVLVQSTDASDPAVSLKTTNTAHQVDFALDESAVADHVDFKGQTASVGTFFHIIAQTGQIAKCGVVQGTYRGELIMGAAGHLSLINTAQDCNLVLGIDDGGVDKTITWDADVDKLKHSAGTFDFDNDNITSTGILTAGALSESNILEGQVFH